MSKCNPFWFLVAMLLPLYCEGSPDIRLPNDQPEQPAITLASHFGEYKRGAGVTSHYTGTSLAQAAYRASSPSSFPKTSGSKPKKNERHDQNSQPLASEHSSALVAFHLGLALVFLAGFALMVISPVFWLVTGRVGPALAALAIGGGADVLAIILLGLTS